MADPSQDNTIQGLWHFGVPIYEKHLAAYAAHQEAVLEYLHGLRDADTGLNRSNQGGWHSSDKLHLTDNAAVSDLIMGLLHVASACVRDFEGERPVKDIRMVDAWVNINRKGDWNVPHEHLPCHWSGVFYADAGSPLSGEDPEALEGRVLFFDPLPLGREWKRPPNVAYTPKTGTMLLFPSFLTHMVAPYYGERPRVSIAFNLMVDRDEPL